LGRSRAAYALYDRTTNQHVSLTPDLDLTVDYCLDAGLTIWFSPRAAEHVYKVGARRRARAGD
jgi:hypothetical protein